MKLSKTQEIELKHSKEYRLAYHRGFIADADYDYLVWNANEFRFERQDVFNKLPVVFEPSFLIFRDSIGVIKFDGGYAQKLFKEGNLEIKS